MVAYLEMIAQHIRSESEAEMAIAAFVEPVALKPETVIQDEKPLDLGHWVHSQILPKQTEPKKEPKKVPKSSHGGENSQRRIKRDLIEGARRIVTRNELNEATQNYVKTTNQKKEKILYSCNSCERRPSENRNLLFDHVQHNHLDISIPCSICDQVFSSCQRFSHHNALDHTEAIKKRRRNRSENPIKDILGSVKLFGSSPPVETAPEDKHPEKTISCNNCERRFEHERGLSLHKAHKHRKVDTVSSKNMQIASPKGQENGAGESDVPENKRLKTKIHKEGTLAPPDQQLNVEIDLHISVITSISKKEKVFVCCICTHEFRQKANLRHHVETHLNYKHLCKSCEFESNSSQMMMSHKKMMHASFKAYIRPIAWLQPF